MDKMPTSSDYSDDNVSKLTEQQQLANQIGPRRFCNDVLLDALHFLRRNEHAQVRLASRRLQWLSNTACARYPPREVLPLEVCGVQAVDSVHSSEKIVANSMRVHPSSGDSYLADFPAVEPPEDIVKLSELQINDFVGPELIQFLGVSGRLMNGCTMVFSDFHNFVSLHSTNFVSRFFALFPSNRAIDLNHVSSLAIPLFTDHPTIFDGTHLAVQFMDTFPLDTLQQWLHRESEGGQERNLTINFENQPDHSTVAYVDHFAQQAKQRFLSATSCCPFDVEIVLPAGGFIDIPELESFVENNEQTGEQFLFIRCPYRYYYIMKRRRREIAGQGEGDKEAEKKDEEKTEKKMEDDTPTVFIEEMVQGDKQPEYPDFWELMILMHQF